jgi:hypothetical protein
MKVSVFLLFSFSCENKKTEKHGSINFGCAVVGARLNSQHVHVGCVKVCNKTPPSKNKEQSKVKRTKNREQST